ncbi:hypothetical protein AX17_006412 [Amanita inopinata Kibby_2008]|nr:hypothetical protein AX17_006412 [Amanita inopinata Kibby_2008]
MDTQNNRGDTHNNAESEGELDVTFQPPLYLQRRLWILNILRAESVTKVLDVGCGEGQLLSVLCQPAPWLSPPPPATILPLRSSSPSSSASQSLQSLSPPEEVTYLHVSLIHGLDISLEDLKIAVHDTAPVTLSEASYAANFQSSHSYTNESVRWEELQVKIWNGGFQTINEEFIGIECIVSTEVIEHLPPDIFPLFAPILMGIYHPHLFLVTTPSYTFNARFTSPTAPLSARRGFRDPTGRTERIFRHEDHKFEWTVEEFKSWCEQVASDWGYEVSVSSIGRAVEADVWGRDEELGGASQVVVFRRLKGITSEERESKAKAVLRSLRPELESVSEGHVLLASHQYSAHPSAMKPKPLQEIGDAIKSKMEELQVSFVGLEELWFEHDIAVMCGGWIEALARAAEESEHLRLNRGDGVGKRRAAWTIQLIGAEPPPTTLWPTKSDASVDTVPPECWVPKDWAPIESSKGGSDWGSGWGVPVRNEDNFW